MAKFLTIVQAGFTFQVHDADKLVEDEEWTIERVAAFMSVHHVLNILATRYAKGLTYRTAVAAIQYTLTCDPETSADLNRLTKYLVPKLTDVYQDSSRQGLLGKPLAKILDEVTAWTEEYVRREEEPITVFGRVVPSQKFYCRPSREEYDAEIAIKSQAQQSLWDTFKESLNEGKAVGHTIHIREGSNEYTGIIVKISPKCVYCDVKDEYGRLLQSGARFPRDSRRFIIETFR